MMRRLKMIGVIELSLSFSNSFNIKCRKAHVREQSFHYHSQTSISCLLAKSKNKLGPRMSESLGSMSVTNSDLTQYSQSRPFLTPKQPLKKLNLDAHHHYHSTLARLQQGNFSFRESYLGHTIPCPHKFSQILDPKHHTDHSCTNSSDQAWLEDYVTSALPTCTATLKRSLNFTAKSVTERGTKLPQKEWLE